MKPKKMLSVFIAMIMSVMSISVSVTADNDDFVIDENGVLVEYKGTDWVVTIPDGITAIGEKVFCDRNFVYRIVIPAGVTSISPSAFAELQLEDIIVSEDNSVYKSVDGVLFTKDGKTLINCPAFNRREYTVPDGVTAIGDSAFNGNVTLLDVTIPDSVTSIGADAFAGCTELKDITLPDGLTSIGAYAFYNCDGLTEVKIPDGISSIEKGTFAYCNNLEKVILPDSLLKIGDGAFTYTRLSCITIPSSVTEIGFGAFGSCSKLMCIIIPKNVTSIGRSALASTRVTVYCYKDSAAYSYVMENNIPYVHVITDEVSIPGDTNGDGQVSLTDVSLMIKHVANWRYPIDHNAADATADGNINLNDVSLILKYIANWDVTLG